MLRHLLVPILECNHERRVPILVSDIQIDIRIQKLSHFVDTIVPNTAEQLGNEWVVLWCTWGTGYGGRDDSRGVAFIVIAGEPARQSVTCILRDINLLKLLLRSL